MGNDRYFADIYVHLRPDRPFEGREQIEKELCNSCGVFSVHFDADKARDDMVVAYDPEAVSSDDLLAIIRNHFERAISVASVLMRVSAD